MSATMTLKSVRSRSQARRTRGVSLLRRGVMAIALPVIILALWWWLSASSSSYLNPPLSVIFDKFIPTWFGGDTFAQTRFASDVIPSLLRVVVGYMIALVLGVVLGVVIGSSRTTRAVVEPVLEFFRAIPPPVLVPIFMLFMGIGSEMKVAVIAIGCLWPVLLNTVEGVRGIDPVQRDIARSYRFTRWGRLTRLTLPAASPQIVTGARQALSIGIILMVIGEMFAAIDGLGFSIVQFQRSFAIPEMWGGVILLGLMGVFLALIFRFVVGMLMGWYYGYLQTNRGGA